MQAQPVKDYPDFVRDQRSSGVLNKNIQEYERFMAQKANRDEQNRRLSEMESRIQRIEAMVERLLEFRNGI